MKDVEAEFLFLMQCLEDIALSDTFLFMSKKNWICIHYINI